MKIEQFATVAGAARVVGIPRSTIRSAIDRGELEVHHLGDGTAVVDMDELRTWKSRREENSEKNQGGISTASEGDDRH